MRILSKVGACLLIAALSTVARAEGAAPKAERPFSRATLNAFLEALNTNRQTTLFSGPPVPCTFDVECKATLTPQELFDTNNNLVACAMQVGEIDLTLPSHPIPGVVKTVI